MWLYGSEDNAKALSDVAKNGDVNVVLIIGMVIIIGGAMWLLYKLTVKNDTTDKASLMKEITEIKYEMRLNTDATKDIGVNVLKIAEHNAQENVHRMQSSERMGQVSSEIEDIKSAILQMENQHNRLSDTVDKGVDLLKEYAMKDRVKNGV